MSMTELELCNAALAKLGANPITALGDGSTEGELASQLYPITIDAVLISFPWSFSLAQQQLSAAPVPPVADFTNAFSLPADVLRTISAGAPGSGRGLFFRIFGAELHTDADRVVLTYQRRIAATDFPAYFLPTVINRLSADLCLPLTESASRAEILSRLAAAELQHARLIDSQQASPRAVEDFTLIAARY